MTLSELANVFDLKFNWYENPIILLWIIITLLLILNINNLINSIIPIIKNIKFDKIKLIKSFKLLFIFLGIILVSYIFIKIKNSL